MQKWYFCPLNLLVNFVLCCGQIRVMLTNSNILYVFDHACQELYHKKFQLWKLITVQLQINIVGLAVCGIFFFFFFSFKSCNTIKFRDVEKSRFLERKYYPYCLCVPLYWSRNLILLIKQLVKLRLCDFGPH